MYLDHIKKLADSDKELYLNYRDYLRLFRDLKEAEIDLDKTLDFESFIDLLNLIEYAHVDTKNKTDFKDKLKKLMEIEEFEPLFLQDF